MTQTSGTQLPQYESPYLGPWGDFIVTFTLDYELLERTPEGQILGLHVSPSPSKSYSINKFLKVTREMIGEAERLVYYFRDNEDVQVWTGPVVIEQEGVSFSFTASYAFDRYYTMAKLFFTRGGGGCSFPATISLSESAWHYIGNTPDQEGPPEGNPYVQ